MHGGLWRVWDSGSNVLELELFEAAHLEHEQLQSSGLVFSRARKGFQVRSVHSIDVLFMLAPEFRVADLVARGTFVAEQKSPSLVSKTIFVFGKKWANWSANPGNFSTRNPLVGVLVDTRPSVDVLVGACAP